MNQNTKYVTGDVVIKVARLKYLGLSKIQHKIQITNEVHNAGKLKNCTSYLFIEISSDSNKKISISKNIRVLSSLKYSIEKKSFILISI